MSKVSFLISFSCRQSFKFTRSKHPKTKLLPAIPVDGKYMVPVRGKWDYAEYASKESNGWFFLQPPIQTLSPKFVDFFRLGNLPRMILVQLTESRWFESSVESEWLRFVAGRWRVSIQFPQGSWYDVLPGRNKYFPEN